MPITQMQRKIDGERYLRILPHGIRNLSEETRQVELSFSSEQPYERWFGAEVLSHDEGAINLARLGEVGALLFHHGRDPNIGSVPLGRIIQTELDAENHRAKAVVAFDTDEKSDLIYQKVKSGGIRGVSVGYSIDAYEEVKAGKSSANGRHTGPCVVATKWSPYEISIEPTPADDSVGVGRSIHEGEDYKMADTNQNTAGACEKTVDPTAIPTPAPAAGTISTGADPDQARTEGAIAERTRVNEITAMCRDFQISDEQHTQLINDGISVHEARAVVLETMKQQGRSQSPVSAANIEVTVDEEDKYRSAARDGLMLRMGFSVEKPADGAGNFRGMTLRSLAADCLLRGEGTDREVMRMEDNDLLRSALGYDQTRGVLQPNSTFVSIVNNTMGAVLANGYQTANTTFQLWTGKGSNPNFKTAKRFRLSAAGEPVEIKQGGEFKADSTTDEGVETALKTYVVTSISQAYEIIMQSGKVMYAKLDVGLEEYR